MSLLAVELVERGVDKEISDSVLLSEIVARALHLSIEAPYRPGDDPVKSGARLWKKYKFSQWTVDLLEVFGEPDIPENHPCASLYASVSAALPSLCKPETVAAALAEILHNIAAHKSALRNLHETAPAYPAEIPLGMVVQRLQWMIRFLMQIEPLVRKSDLSPRVTNMLSLLRLGLTCCKTSEEDWWPRLQLGSGNAVTNPFRTDSAMIRQALRQWMRIVPLERRADLLSHLVAFDPEDCDQALFLDRFDAGDENALRYFLKLWPGEDASALIEGVLNKGLAAMSEQLEVTGVSGSKDLTILGQQVAKCLVCASHHLPVEKLLPYLIAYLNLSPVDKFRAAAARELGERGGYAAAAALAGVVPSVGKGVFGSVAEAIGKVPTPDAFDALLIRLSDRSLRLDRIDAIRTLIEHRPDEALRKCLEELLQEPGCRCGGCVWRAALREMAKTWRNERSRALVERLLNTEPGYEGRIGAARILAAEWPDQRTVGILEQYLGRPVFGSGEGESGHLPLDGKTNLDQEEREDLVERYSMKCDKALRDEIDGIMNPSNDESEQAAKTNEMIRQMFFLRGTLPQG